MNLTTATPAEIDAAWFPLMAATQNAETGLSVARQSIHGTEAVIARREAAVAVATAAEAPYRAEWDRRGGWTRAYLAITNGKGHVHARTSCSTCYVTTQFAVLADLSGLDRDAVVNAIGQDACTVCFPGAPVTPRTVFTADELRDRAERAAVEIDRAAKAAAKAAKAITNPDGTELREAGRWGSALKTEVSARNRAVDVLATAQLYARPLDLDEALTVEAVIAALGAKHGTDPADVRADLDARATKKHARDKREGEKAARALGLLPA